MPLSSHASEREAVKRQIIAPQTGAGLRLYRGDRLKVTDPCGQQVSDLFCVLISNPRDALSSGRSIDYEDKILFSRGDTLYSENGIPMLKIVEDSCGRHDFLVTPCSAQMFLQFRGCDGFHPNCKHNLYQAFEDVGISLKNIGTTFNIFMNVTFDLSGRIRVETPKSRPGDEIVFEALDHLFVGLTACADEGTNGGTCKPIEFQIIRRQEPYQSVGK